MSNSFSEKLKQYLSNSGNALPGAVAHLRMCPTLVNGTRIRNLVPPSGAQKSAVLIVLYPDGDGVLHTLITLRSEKLNNHGGQWSFPGGRLDRGETHVEAALREAQEEIGLDVQEIVVLGSLSELFVEVSNSAVLPVVAFVSTVPELSICTDEVSLIKSLCLEDLDTRFSREQEIWRLRDIDLLVPFWRVDHITPLWGLTAMIMEELLEVVKSFKAT